jgi:ABC-type transport system substrate-binding protein
MRENKNKNYLNWAIIVAILANIAVFSGFSALFITSFLNIEFQPNEILKVSRTSNPVTMDPLDSWDSISNDMLDQVVETLIAYDLTDPNLPLVGRLAESWYWPDNTTIEFKLRENVFYHDGSRFTADCVLHTIARINYFGNWSGTLDRYTQVKAFPHSLYKFRDGRPIFNDTLSFATDDYNVTLILNRPYTPGEGLLAYTASSILHPDSTPSDKMLELGEDLVIGTGPFKIIRYIPNSEILFARWERYWRTGAYWDEIVYVYYRDAVTANNAMINLEIDYIGQGIHIHDFVPEITITGDGVHDYINGSIYWYLAFNNEIINRTWRKAISLAFNYTYLNEDINEGTTERARSLVPPGFPAHNKSVRAFDYDIPKARQYMQKMELGVGWEIGIMNGVRFTPGADEALWQSASFIPELGNFSGNQWNIRHRQGSHFMELFIQRLTEDLDYIGINIAPQLLSWDDFIEMGELNPERLHLYYLGWGPEYFDPFVMIEPLVNPISSSNLAKINHTEINDVLTKATIETDTNQRIKYYKKLQYLIIEKYVCHMPLEYDKIYFAHATSLKGFPYNCMRSLYWYPTYRG